MRTIQLRKTMFFQIFLKDIPNFSSLNPIPTYQPTPLSLQPLSPTAPSQQYSPDTQKAAICLCLAFVLEILACIPVITIIWDRENQMPKMMLRSLLKIFSFSIFYMSDLVRLQYDRSSHYRSFKPSRISVTTSVEISLATTLNLFNFTQFLQIARKPSFVMPVAPMKSSSICFIYLPIILPPFCISLVLAICSTFSSCACLLSISMHLEVSRLQETNSCSRNKLLKNICSNPSSVRWLSIRQRMRSRWLKNLEMLNSESSVMSQLFSYRCTRPGQARRNFISIGQSIFVKLYFSTWMLLRESSISSWSLVRRWLLMSNMSGLGTRSRMSGNSLSSTSLRSKHRDLPLEPMMPFLMSISSFIFFSFSSASIFSRSSRSFFCSHACNSAANPSIFSSNSDILITLSRTSFLLRRISLSFICRVFLDCSTSPSSRMRSMATSLDAWYRLQKDSSWWLSDWTVSALNLLRCSLMEFSISLMTTLIMDLTSTTIPAHISLVVSEYHLNPSPFSMILPSRRLMISASLMVSSSILLGSFLICFVSDFFISFSVSSMMNLLLRRQFVSSLSISPRDSPVKALILSTRGEARLSKSWQICLMMVSCASFSLMSTSLSLSILLQECISARLDSSQMNCAGWMSRCSRRHFSQISLFAHLEQQHMYSHIFLWISHSEFIRFFDISLLRLYTGIGGYGDMGKGIGGIGCNGG